MKKIGIPLAILLMMSSCDKQTTSFSVMTYNVRYGLADDGKNSWEFRRDNLTDLINHYNPDFLGTQEGLPFQINYI